MRGILPSGIEGTKPAPEHATQGHRLQDDAVAAEDAEGAKPEGKYQTGQVWQDYENRSYVGIVELLYPESPEEGRSSPFDYSLVGKDMNRLDSNPYVHILRFDDNTTESYRKKDFEKRFRYAPEGRQ